MRSTHSLPRVLFATVAALSLAGGFAIAQTQYDDINGQTDIWSNTESMAVESLSSSAATSSAPGGWWDEGLHQTFPIAGSMQFSATMTGSQEVPPVNASSSAGHVTSGEIKIHVNQTETHAAFDLTVWHGQNITEAHLHCAPVGENGPVIAFLFGTFPGGVDVHGRLSRFVLTDANIVPAGSSCATPVTDIESLVEAIGDGIIYANVHNLAIPTGLIRGQLGTTTPGGGNGTTTPGNGNGTTTPNGDNGTTTPNGDNGTTTPNGNGTTTPNGNNGTTTPNGNGTTTPGNGDNGTTTPGGDLAHFFDLLRAALHELQQQLQVLVRR
ncbi:CHRD domain-containing protein [Candidatus Parcubacteria bacterium]|nr:MAG: CHRD domain-containing protein [Candidatus Parcubacteria bacterium]